MSAANANPFPVSDSPARNPYVEAEGQHLAYKNEKLIPWIIREAEANGHVLSGHVLTAEAIVDGIIRDKQTDGEQKPLFVRPPPGPYRTDLFPMTGADHPFAPLNSPVGQYAYIALLANIGTDLAAILSAQQPYVPKAISVSSFKVLSGSDYNKAIRVAAFMAEYCVQE